MTQPPPEPPGPPGSSADGTMPTVPGPGGAPSPRNPQPRRRWPIVLAIVLVVTVIGAGVGVVVTRSDDDKTAGSDEVKPVTPPAEWDPRLADIADYVAGERGLDWDHPVPARFLGAKDFESEITTDQSDLSDEDRQDIEDGEGFLKALGLVPADFDLFESYNDAQAAGTIAFYDPRKEEIVVRGKKVDVQSRVTLAHELTHALQDQQFELDQLQEDASKAGNSLALTSVVEGDANNVENAFVADVLTDAEQQIYETQSASSSDDATDRFRDEEIPEFIEVFIGAPYALGPAFVHLVAAENGRRGRDDLFRADITESEIITPSRNLDNTEVIDVDPIDPPDGAESVQDATSFGAIGWYLMLAARLDAADALAAVDGWAGDTSTSYKRDDRLCVAAAFEGSSLKDTARMKAALQDWIAAGPKASASVRDRDADLVFETCEPERVMEPTQSLTDALILATARMGVFGQVLDAVDDVDAAWCVATAVTGDAELRPLLLSPDAPSLEQQEFITTRVATLAAPCGLSA